MNVIIENVAFIRVRYADTDKMGVVYNGNYFTFFEVGRTELMRAYGLPYTSFETEGYILPLIEAHANYKNSAYYDDLLEVNAWLDINKIGATLRFEYEITFQDKIIANGYTLHSFVKKETMKPVRPPKFFIEMIESLKNNFAESTT
jgi:acyl-CoA thioester hydrolase